MNQMHAKNPKTWERSCRAKAFCVFSFLFYCEAIRRVSQGLLRMVEKKRRHGSWQQALLVQILANLIEKSGVSLKKCVLKSVDIVGVSRKHHFNFYFCFASIFEFLISSSTHQNTYSVRLHCCFKLLAYNSVKKYWIWGLLSLCKD